MSRMKDLYLDIVELYDRGYSAQKIANLLEVPIDQVQGVIEGIEEDYDYTDDGDYTD